MEQLALGGSAGLSSSRVDRERLQVAMSAAHLPSLLMVLYQLTGDEKWLRDPYRPARSAGLDINQLGGFPEEIQGEIREAALHAVMAWTQGREPSVPEPDDALLVKMLATCVSEEVPDPYAPLIAQEMRLRVPEEPSLGGGAGRDRDFRVAIIGAGVSGLGLSYRLQTAGVEHVILEKNPDLGGSWYENRYPGAGVDTPSYLYSFSYFPSQWSTFFGRRDEVQAYLQEVADHFDLRKNIRFQTEVMAAEWDEGCQRWQVTTRDASGQETTTRYHGLVSAVGQLNRPKIPHFPDRDRFRGESFHSAQWPDDLDLTGKKVAVVGTGASAMQIVSFIADEVDELTVFQRSPQWIAPNDDILREVEEGTHYLMEVVPFYHAWYRAMLWWTFTDRIHNTLRIDRDWPHLDRSINAVNDSHRRHFTRYLEQELEGREDLQEKSLPDYPPFGKRMLLDNGWYRAIRRDNVRLVDQPVAAFAETGVRTAEGEEYEADVVVLATGFEAKRLLHPMEITGRDGQSLRDFWGEEDATAYLGMTTPGFPNLFILYGPNTNLGHGGSFIFISESQAHYVADLLCRMVLEDIGVLEVKREVHDEYNQSLDAAHAEMIWSHRGMDTWYRNSKGRVVTNFPWRLLDYWQMTRSVDLDSYEVTPAVAESTP
ncbi:MAG: NAD(P)/FAD-dependent oxidoreductase [Actinomycetota bacterium]